MRHSLMLSFVMLLLGWLIGQADQAVVVADASTPPCICATVSPTVTQPPTRTPTPTMVTQTAVVTPIGGAATCSGFPAAEGIKWEYRYTDPNRTGISAQNVRTGPGIGWRVVDIIPRGEWRQAYWKLGEWIALSRNCDRWVNMTLGEYRVDF